ncbi:MAG: YbaB/EbfC family nucleoid-associated protein [Xanthomonadales bacterium]|nr:YbaB/EbfC family nucleoid-associated protein [Xanthomonadales bacterium]
MLGQQLGELIRQARELQERLAAVQAQLAREEVVGRAGGGMVEIRMSGSLEVRGLRIEAAAREGPPELLEDLIAAAFNDALERARALGRERLASLGLGLPPGLLAGFPG